jgi:hypothetical protein
MENSDRQFTEVLREEALRQIYLCEKCEDGDITTSSDRMISPAEDEYIPCPSCAHLLPLMRPSEGTIREVVLA